MKPALNDNLMDRICASENVRTAWKRVKSNGGSAGADGMSIDTFLGYSKNTLVAHPKVTVGWNV